MGSVQQWPEDGGELRRHDLLLLQAAVVLQVHDHRVPAGTSAR